MKKVKLWRVTFDVLIEGITTPQTRTTYAVGTDDLNSLREYISGIVCNTEAEIEASDGSHTHKVVRPIVGFDLRTMEDMRFDVDFIDVNALIAAGIISFQEPEAEHEVQQPGEKADL